MFCCHDLKAARKKLKDRLDELRGFYVGKAKSDSELKVMKMRLEKLDAEVASSGDAVNDLGFKLNDAVSDIWNAY